MRELHPPARQVGTTNHEGNTAMPRINRAQGYESSEHWYAYEFPTSG